jgi:hypothetical protein
MHAEHPALCNPCSEDKHVLNRFATITRLVRRVLVDGQPKYIRVRSGDYLLKAVDRPAALSAP